MNFRFESVAALVTLVTVAAAACSRPPEEESPGLAALLRAEHKDFVDIDLGTVAADMVELSRALSMPHGELGKRLGPHRVEGSAKLRVLQGSGELESLESTVSITLAQNGHFLARLSNSKEYGREALWNGSHLFLRPQYGKYHRREPNDASEPAAIRNEIFSTPAAYFELLEPSLDIKSSVEALENSRPVIKIELGEAAPPRQRSAESLGQRKWRESVTVERAAASIWIDKESGTPTFARISGAIGFTRDGKNFHMEIEVTQKVSDFGEQTVSYPAPEMVVDTPTRLHELDERNQLLEGIAPPARKGHAPPAEYE